MKPFKAKAAKTKPTKTRPGKNGPDKTRPSKPERGASADPLAMGSKKWRDMIRQGADDFNVPVNETTASLFALHASELMAWNKKINLTTILDPLEVAVKHFIDSIVPAPLIPKGGRVLDIGSGGGFPGLALKAARPDMDMVMVDASQKKIHFLKHVIRKTGMENITAIHGRAEDLAKDPGFNGSFDVVVCRAFASLGDFFEKGLPFVSKNGFLMAWKGKAGEDEAKEFLSNQGQGRPKQAPTQRNGNDNGRGGGHRNDETSQRNDGFQCDALEEFKTETAEFQMEIKKYALPFLDLERRLMMIKQNAGAPHF